MKVNPPRIIQCSWKQKFVVFVVMATVVTKGNEKEKKKADFLDVCLLTLEKSGSI
jgi:hypothetical protein